MQLTRFSDLGLRVLMYLSAPARTVQVTIGEIASQFGVPHNHLVKVVNRLGKLGCLRATWGRNGGLALAMPASALRLGELLRGLEEAAELIDCDKPPCILQGQCQLKAALNAGLAAFYAAMDAFTLADVSGQRTGEAIVVLHQQFLNREASRHA